MNGKRVSTQVTDDIRQFLQPNNTQCKGKGKGKGTVHLRRAHEGPEDEERYSSNLSLTSALDAGGWSTLRPNRFNPGKDQVLIV
jgi:hypothetical protein